MEWEPDKHEFTNGAGGQVSVEIDEQGIVSVFYESRAATIVEHKIESWNDGGRRYMANVTRISPGEELPSLPAIS